MVNKMDEEKITWNLTDSELPIFNVEIKIILARIRLPFIGERGPVGTFDLIHEGSTVGHIAINIFNDVKLGDVFEGQLIVKTQMDNEKFNEYMREERGIKTQPETTRVKPV